MKEKLSVVKVGGRIVEEEASLDRLLDDFAAVPGPKVLVHGGGRTATDLAARLGIATRMVAGRRVTDAPMLDVATMVYGGLVNKRVVARLQARGTDAVGLTGADMDLVRSHRRPAGEVDFGHVGDVDRVDADRLVSLFRLGVVPVLAPLTHDGAGGLLNTNADTIASEVAKALAGRYDVTLVYCFEHGGVLARADDEGSVIPRLDRAAFRALVADGTIGGGMVPKIENGLAAVEAGVGRVVVTRADRLAEIPRFIGLSAPSRPAPPCTVITRTLHADE